MNRLSLPAAIAAIALLLTACHTDGQSSQTTTSAGSTDTDTMALTRQEMVMEGFDAITLAGTANVVYEHGNEHRVSIEAPADVMPFVNAYVEEEELFIADKPKADSVQFSHVTVTVTSPAVRCITLSGAGNIIAPKPFTADLIDIRLSGAGNVKIADLTCRKLTLSQTGAGNIDFDNLTTDYLDTKLYGAGNVTLCGKAKHHTEHVNGPGNLDISHLTDH